MPKGFSIKKMKEIQEQIHALDDDSQRNILQILHTDSILYTENTNGVFFDLMTLPKDTFEKIINFLKFHENCTEYLDKREKEQNDVKHDIGEIA